MYVEVRIYCMYIQYRDTCYNIEDVLYILQYSRFLWFQNRWSITCLYRFHSRIEYFSKYHGEHWRDMQDRVIEHCTSTYNIYCTGMYKDLPNRGSAIKAHFAGKAELTAGTAWSGRRDCGNGVGWINGLKSSSKEVPRPPVNVLRISMWCPAATSSPHTAMVSFLLLVTVEIKDCCV